MFLWIPASVTDTATDNPNGIKTFLANGGITFLIKDKPFLVMVQEDYPEMFMMTLF